MGFFFVIKLRKNFHRTFKQCSLDKLVFSWYSSLVFTQILRRVSPMEKKQQWRLVVILLVLSFALYNVLPTVLYYTKPLSSPIDEKRAELIAKDVAERLEGNNQAILDRLKSFADQAGISFSKISIDEKDPSTIVCSISSKEDLAKVQSYLPYLGVASQDLSEQFFVVKAEDGEIVLVRHPIVQMPQDKIHTFFTFIPLLDKAGKPTAEWVSLASNRFVTLAQAMRDPLHLKSDVERATSEKNWESACSSLTQRLGDWIDSFGSDTRLFDIVRVSLVQEIDNGRVKLFLQRLMDQKMAMQKEKTSKHDGATVQDKRLLLDEERLDRIIAFMNKVSKAPSVKIPPVPTQKDVEACLKAHNGVATLSLATIHPFFSKMILDVSRNVIELAPVDLRAMNGTSTKGSEDMVRTLFFEEIARLSDVSGERFDQLGQDISASTQSLEIPLTKENTTSSVLALQLEPVAKQLLSSIQNGIDKIWHPKNVNLQKETFPCVTYADFSKYPKGSLDTCLLLFSPSEVQAHSTLPSTSLYAVIKGGKKLEHAEELLGAAQEFGDDLQELEEYLKARGFVAWDQELYARHPEFVNDIVFELADFYKPIIASSQELMYVSAKEKVALLELSTVQQRIRRENAIDDHSQEKLVRERETWQAAKTSGNVSEQLMHPKPSKSVFFENLKRSLRKYFRGDESRVLHWGLDLSGGVSIRVGLVDSNNKPVTDAKDLKQAGNELYSRLNKMGVSERTIRVESETISIDFPGVQGLSAEDLIKASRMTFHVVNERFSPNNAPLAKHVNAFLQEVWNEATLLHAQDEETINHIAWKKWDAVKRGLQMNQDIQALVDNGLVLEDVGVRETSSAFDDSVSMVARLRDQERSEWAWQGHPLMIIFKNYALEGGNLAQVQPSYDPMKGNVLHFSVRSTDSKGREFSPQDAFSTWTAQFCQENIQGTVREQWSRGQGWRMAVILNGTVVSAPHLHSPLKESAMISGNFTQRDVQRLAKDLEAGSLSFAPKILSEENVSPELGMKERACSITAAVLGVILVMAIMISYYRFAGCVASLAVFFNILLLWAVLQNIDAVMTLPALAGFVLTIGLAVDANVLVFERIREELRAGAAMATAITLGYKRAFSAILDSNVTTIIAAFVLVQFDSGPVRGFALTLIIGILASMFTALFVTRYCFFAWLKKVPNPELKMAEWIKVKNVPFFKYTKPYYLITGTVILISLALFASAWRSILGMDFSGGYSVVIEEPMYRETSLRNACEDALTKVGIHSAEYHIRTLGKPDAIRLQLSSLLDEKGHLFADVKGDAKLHQLVNALEQKGLKLSQETKERMDKSWTAISGQFSEVMKRNALLAISIALCAILVYIALRFELKFALSSVAAFLYNALLTLSILVILHFIGMDVQLNLEAIGALLTILGYVLNDTIIVFDRVRELSQTNRKKPFKEVINLSLNQTLSRTIMTSFMTLASLFALLVIGGSSVFTFILIMFIGVLFGPAATFFVACPLLEYFHKRESAAEGDK